MIKSLKRLYDRLCMQHSKTRFWYLVPKPCGPGLGLPSSLRVLYRGVVILLKAGVQADGTQTKLKLLLIARAHGLKSL